MVTWLPAAVSIAERITCFSTTKFLKIFSNKLNFPFKSLSQLGQSIEEAIISVVLNYSKICIIILGIIGILSGIIVFYYPQIKLPDTPEFKLFVSSHPFEVYDSIYKDIFWFEKSSMVSFKQLKKY